MRAVVGSLVGATLLALALLHVLWALGRKPIGAAVIPAVGGKPVFAPGPIATLAVAVALALAATIVAAHARLIGGFSDTRLMAWACGVVGSVFLLRAIGEFRLVGFFKSVTGTPFARWDTLVYSPLCLALGLAALWLAVTRR